MASESALIPLEPPASAGLALQPRSCPFNIIFWVYNLIQLLVRALQQSGAGREETTGCVAFAVISSPCGSSALLIFT